jgi:hypothetical protein
MFILLIKHIYKLGYLNQYTDYGLDDRGSTPGRSNGLFL